MGATETPDVTAVDMCSGVVRRPGGAPQTPMFTAAQGLNETGLSELKQHFVDRLGLN